MTVTELAVITPSFAPDAELFVDLHRSVLRYTPEETVHHVVVPDSDRALFERHASPRLRVWPASELLPRRYIRVPKPGVWVNARRPWPPVRGWVMQQALKIAVSGVVDVKTVIVADSDVVLVRPTSSDLFTVDGKLCLYRLEDGVNDTMPRHETWHHVARRLLGLQPPGPLPLPDYVSPLNVWDTSVVRAMQRRITEVTGRHWMDAFTSELHVSEFIVYGVFADELHGPRGPELHTEFCHNYWPTVPLDVAGATAFADRLGTRSLGMMISAKSHTPLDARQAAVRRCEAITAP